MNKSYNFLITLDNSEEQLRNGQENDRENPSVEILTAYIKHLNAVTSGLVDWQEQVDIAKESGIRAFTTSQENFLAHASLNKHLVSILKRFVPSIFFPVQEEYREEEENDPDFFERFENPEPESAEAVTNNILHEIFANDISNFRTLEQYSGYGDYLRIVIYRTLKGAINSDENLKDMLDVLIENDSTSEIEDNKKDPIMGRVKKLQKYLFKEIIHPRTEKPQSSKDSPKTLDEALKKSLETAQVLHEGYFKPENLELQLLLGKAFAAYFQSIGRRDAKVHADIKTRYTSGTEAYKEALEYNNAMCTFFIKSAEIYRLSGEEIRELAEELFGYIASVNKLNELYNQNLTDGIMAVVWTYASLSRLGYHDIKVAGISEDEEGVDLEAVKDGVKFYIQVKSSPIHKRPEQNIPVGECESLFFIPGEDKNSQMYYLDEENGQKFFISGDKSLYEYMDAVLENNLTRTDEIQDRKKADRLIGSINASSQNLKSRVRNLIIFAAKHNGRMIWIYTNPNPIGVKHNSVDPKYALNIGYNAT